MKPLHYIVGIIGAVLVGTLLGKALFPPPQPALDRGASARAVGRVSALPAAGAPHGTPDEVFESLLAGRRSTNPVRAELEMRLKLRAMSDDEIVAIAQRIVAGEFAFTRYEAFFLAGIWKRYAAIDPEAAHLAAGRLPTRIMRHAASQVAAAAWSLADPAGALAAFIKAETENPHGEVSSLGTALRVLAQSDPERAIRAIEGHRDAPWFARARGSLFYSWSTTDKEAARGWLLGQMSDKPSDASRILLDLSAQDPADALELALGMEPNEDLSDAVGEIIVGRWMWRDRDAALLAFKNLPPEWHSERMADNFGMNGVTDLTTEQIDEIAAVFPDDDLRNFFWRTVVSRRASDAKFDDATVLLDRLVPGDARAAGASDVAVIWAKANPKQASEWLSSLEPGQVRDAAVAAFAGTIAPLDPGSARRWAESIGDGTRRARALEKLGAR